MIDWRDYLVRNPKVCGGKLTAKGTRVFVSNILDTFAESHSIEEILRSYPSLTREHVEAAFQYAAELARDEEALPLLS